MRKPITKWSIVIGLAFVLLLIPKPAIAETAQIPVVEYEPAYNDLKIIRAGDMVNMSWNSYQAFDNETNITSTIYRDYVIIRIYFFYPGNNQTYTAAEANSFGVAFGSWINYNTGTSAKWGGTVNLANVNQEIKDNGFYPVFELVEATTQPKVRKGRLYLDDYVYINWKDLNNPMNRFKIYNRTLVYLTNNGSAFHDTLIYDPIILVENVTINTKLYDVEVDDTFARLAIDDSDDVYLEFDGDGDYVEVADDSIFSFGNTTDDIPFSISVWLKPVDVTTATLIAKATDITNDNGEWSLAISSGDLIRFSCFDRAVINRIGVESDDTYETIEGSWTHIAATYDATGANTGMKIYVNGDLIVMGTNDAGSYTAMHNTNKPVQIGVSLIDYDGGRWADGSIDEVRIYNISLSQRDISEIYNSTRVANSSIPNSSDLIAWWQMDEGVGQPLDSSQESNDGTRAGDTSWSTWGLGDNLVGYWSFDADAVDTTPLIAYDFTEYNNNGIGSTGTPIGDVLVNSTNCMNEYGNCAHFDGAGDYILAPDDSSYSGLAEVSLSFWIYPYSFSATTHMLFGKSDSAANREYRIRVEGGNTIRWHISNDGADPGAAENLITIAGNISLNEWNHLVGTYDGSTLKFYVNGELVDTDAGEAGPMYDGAGSFSIGSYGNGGAVSFNGLIDEAMVFSNTTLTAAQVKALYFNSSAMFKTGNQTWLPNNISDGNDRMNVTMNFANNMSSNLSCRGEQINTTAYNTTGLVAYYPMEWGNSTDGKIWDISGWANHGTGVDGATWNATGGQNETGGWEFDGDGDYIEIPNSSSLELGSSNNFTISVWVKWEKIETSQFIVAKTDDTTNYEYALQYYSERIYNSFSSGGTEHDFFYSFTPTLEKFYHIVITYDQTDQKIYVNGTEKASNPTGSFALDRDSDPLRIGGMAGSYFNGSIDEVMIFNRPLSADEISQMYNDTLEKYNTQYYTPWQNMTHGSNIFTIDEEADFLGLQCKGYPGNSTKTPFYTPIWKGNITVETYSSIVPDAIDPSGVGFLLPTPKNDTNLTINNYEVNVSFTDENPNSCLLELTNTSGKINYTMVQGDNITEWNINTSHTNNMTWFVAYCRDDAGNWGNSSTRFVNISFEVVGDTCDTCTIDCSENCIVDSELDCGGGALSFYNGPGVIGIQADIKNWNKVLTDDTGCGIICDGGCIV